MNTCPECDKKIRGKDFNRFFRFLLIPTVSQCPHCGVTLAIPLVPWEKMWLGVLIFAAPSWLEWLTWGQTRYSYLVLPIALWLIWSNNKHLRLSRVAAEPGEGMQESETRGASSEAKEEEITTE